MNIWLIKYWLLVNCPIEICLWHHDLSWQYSPCSNPLTWHTCIFIFVSVFVFMFPPSSLYPPVARTALICRDRGRLQCARVPVWRDGHLWAWRGETVCNRQTAAHVPAVTCGNRHDWEQGHQREQVRERGEREKRGDRERRERWERRWREKRTRFWQWGLAW